MQVLSYVSNSCHTTLCGACSVHTCAGQWPPGAECVSVSHHVTTITGEVKSYQCTSVIAISCHGYPDKIPLEKCNQTKRFTQFEVQAYYRVLHWGLVSSILQTRVNRYGLYSFMALFRLYN